MVKGMNNYEGKDRGRIRRRNHIARDLATPKYRQRVKEGKKPQVDDGYDWEDEVDEYFREREQEENDNE